MSYIAPSIFVNHGGGPKPIYDEGNNRDIANHLRNLHKYLNFEILNAIIIITAHREETNVTISSGKQHKLLFDYYNFPEETYKYTCPKTAHDLHKEFAKTGIKSVLDETRGWDHGVFIPMMLINPKANIPIVQVSILSNQNAVDHFKIGRVLHRFRERGIAVIGSGMSYHNMGEMRKAMYGKNDGVVVNEDFDGFLNEACTGKVEELVKWEEFPGAHEMHPLGGAEHLMPLIVCAGAGGGVGGTRIYNSVFSGKFKLSGFLWE